MLNPLPSFPHKTVEETTAKLIAANKAAANKRLLTIYAQLESQLAANTVSSITIGTKHHGHPSR